MRLCAVTFKKLILYSLAAYTVSLGSYILPFIWGRNGQRGKKHNLSLWFSACYTVTSHFWKISVRIMGGKGRKPEFGHQLKSNQYHPSTKKRHAWHSTHEPQRGILAISTPHWPDDTSDMSMEAFVDVEMRICRPKPCRISCMSRKKFRHLQHDGLLIWYTQAWPASHIGLCIWYTPHAGHMLGR